VADEEFDGTDMVFYLLGEGQRGAYEARKALPQGVVESFDLIGFPRLLRDGFVTLRRNDPIVYFILVRVKDGVFLIDLRDLAPQGFGTLTAPIAGSVTKRLLCLPGQSPNECKTRGEEGWHCPPRGEADAHNSHNWLQAFKRSMIADNGK